MHRASAVPSQRHREICRPHAKQPRTQPKLGSQDQIRERIINPASGLIPVQAHNEGTETVVIERRRSAHHDCRFPAMINGPTTDLTDSPRAYSETMSATSIIAVTGRMAGARIGAPMFFSIFYDDSRQNHPRYAAIQLPSNLGAYRPKATIATCREAFALLSRLPELSLVTVLCKTESSRKDRNPNPRKAKPSVWWKSIQRPPDTGKNEVTTIGLFRRTIN